MGCKRCFLRKATADISRLIPEFTDLLDKIGVDLSTENSTFVMATCGGCIHSPGTEHILDLHVLSRECPLCQLHCPHNRMCHRCHLCLHRVRVPEVLIINVNSCAVFSNVNNYAVNVNNYAVCCE